MAGRGIGPKIRARAAWLEKIKTTDMDTLVELFGAKCYIYHPNARNCPLCYIWKQAIKGLWLPEYRFPDGKWYAMPKSELYQRLWKYVKSHPVKVTTQPQL